MRTARHCNVFNTMRWFVVGGLSTGGGRQSIETWTNNISRPGGNLYSLKCIQCCDISSCLHLARKTEMAIVRIKDQIRIEIQFTVRLLLCINS